MTAIYAESNFPKLLDERLRECSEAAFKEIPEQRKLFFRELPSDSAWEEFYEIGALPDIPEFTNQLTYLSQAPGFLSRLQPKEYAAGIQFERKLLADKKYNVMTGGSASMGESAARVMEKTGANIFINAFSAAFTFLFSEEGVALCSTAHTTKAGVSTASGFSNSGTSALNKASIAATRLLMRRFRNDIGERISIEPDTLVVPDSLYDTAMEITQTKQGYDTAGQDVNMQAGRWKVIPYLRLDDNDTNNWFMVDSRLMKKFLLWITREAPDFKTNFDFQTFITQFSVYFRIACGFTNWRWIYGHNVT